MRKIIPYILFYVFAICVFITMSVVTYGLLVFVFMIKGCEPTFIANYISVIVGVFSSVLFIVGEK